jgi:hypothetical protein
MSQTLTVQLSDTTFAVLEERARAVGKSPGELAAIAVEEHLHERNGATQNRQTPVQPAGEKKAGLLERHFGAVSLGYPIATDNEALDAALAEEYLNNHEDE